MFTSQVSKVLDQFILAREPLLLAGAPGVGKTDLVRQAAARCNYDCEVFHPAVDEPIDYKGFPFSDGKVASFLPFDQLDRLVNAKEPLVAFFDDLGQATDAVQAAAMQLFLNRAVGSHKVSEHVVFIGATNRREDKAGVNGILEPLKSRFCSIIGVEVNVDDWIKDFAIGHGIHELVIGFAKFRPSLLHQFNPTTDLTNSPSPRTAAHVSAIMKMDLPEDLRWECIKGAAGTGYENEFSAFVKDFTKLPDIDGLIANPNKKVMDSIRNEPSVMYALTAALVNRADKKRMSGITGVVEMMPSEYAVLTMRHIATKDVKLTENGPALAWMTKNAKILGTVGR